MSNTAIIHVSRKDEVDSVWRKVSDLLDTGHVQTVRVWDERRIRVEASARHARSRDSFKYAWFNSA